MDGSHSLIMCLLGFVEGFNIRLHKLDHIRKEKTVARRFTVVCLERLLHVIFRRSINT